jgi:TolA-binding protein
MKTRKLLMTIAITLLPLTAMAHAESDTDSSLGAGSNSHLQLSQQAHQQLDQAKEDAKKGMDERKNQAKNQSEKKKDELCSRVSDRIGKRQTNAAIHKQKLDAHYTKIEGHWQTIIDRATAAGIDASKLTADLATLKEKVAKLDSDLDLLAAALQNTTNFQCGYSHGDFKHSLGQAKTEWKQVKSDLADIKSFRKTVRTNDIVPIITALNAAQKPTTVPVAPTGSGGGAQ